jgi:hypothetical protein
MGSVSLRAYWWRVARRAYDDTKKALHSNPTKAAITVLIALASCVAIWIFTGRSVAEKILWTIAVTAISCLVFVGRFLYRVLQVPAVLEAEIAAESEQTINDLKARVDSLSREIATENATFADITELFEECGCKGRRIMHDGERENGFVQRVLTIVGESLRGTTLRLWRQNCGDNLRNWTDQLTNHRLQPTSARDDFPKSRHREHMVWAKSR